MDEPKHLSTNSNWSGKYEAVRDFCWKPVIHPKPFRSPICKRDDVGWRTLDHRCLKTIVVAVLYYIEGGICTPDNNDRLKKAVGQPILFVAFCGGVSP
jgi:hypothetical protein